MAALLGVALAGHPARAEDQEQSPFRFSPAIVTNESATSLALRVVVPSQHHLYADTLQIEVDGAPVRPSLPQAKSITDRATGQPRRAFEGDFVITHPLPPARSAAVTLAVTFQGCNEEECFFPETRRWTLSPENIIARVDEDNGALAAASPQGASPQGAASQGAALIDGFRVSARASGYLAADRFAKFLREARTGQAANDSSPFAGLGLIATVGLILVGGMALNLTPCVLPMIPINLAVLGAGARSGNRRRGFALGGAYGTGMALAYGGVGLAVVLTGSKFGMLNSSPWFNFVIALVFVVLGLGMFDRIPIDFSRFQRGSAGDGGRRGAFLTATSMGFLSALLAGACVAPVVISVLLLAATLYQKGHLHGLMLPFVLGLGMALPWPFAAAGLSFLPKPGAWMARVKYGFGGIIFAFAAWYGWLGWSLASPVRAEARMTGAPPSGLPALEAGLETSRRTGRPVLIDFWASWCKNCSAMEHVTFRNPEVQQQLGKFVFVKFQAERLNDPAIKPVLDQFGVIGLPSYVVLTPAATAPPAWPSRGEEAARLRPPLSPE